MFLLRKCAYPDFLHIISKHTNKEQDGIKRICTEEREKKLWQLKYVFKFFIQISVVSDVVPPTWNNFEALS